ncbi:MAG: hypothetical protein ABS894_00680 [Aerococcus urinaeequi]
MITNGLLSGMAGYISSRISKVVLNGTYVITEFEVNKVEGNTVVLNYIIPASSLSLVTMIEIKDAANVVLSAKPVSLPVQSDTLMLETFEVEEVDI